METRRHRSPTYPAISLKEAIERASVFFRKEGKHKAMIATAAAHWGYSPTSSTRLTTVAALKAYGLMADTGEGPSRQVSLTPLGLSIVQDERSISPARDAAIRDAAGRPRVMADLRERYGTELPSDDTLRHFLKVEKEFNPNAVDDVIRIYRENIAFSGLDESPEIDEEESQASPSWPDTAVAATAVPATTAAPTDPLGGPFGKPDPAKASAVAITGEEIANVRVSRDCTIRLIATGPYSKKSIEALVAQLKLGLDLGTYDDMEDEV